MAWKDLINRKFFGIDTEREYRNFLTKMESFLLIKLCWWHFLTVFVWKGPLVINYHLNLKVRLQFNVDKLIYFEYLDYMNLRDSFMRKQLESFSYQFVKYQLMIEQDRLSLSIFANNSNQTLLRYLEILFWIVQLLFFNCHQMHRRHRQTKSIKFSAIN